MKFVFYSSFTAVIILYRRFLLRISRTGPVCMDTGMAPVAEGDEVFRYIIGAVTVFVVDVEILLCAAEYASPPITFQNDLPERFPFLQAVFVPHRDHYGIAPAEEDVTVTCCIWTGVAEAPVAIQRGAVPAWRNTSGLK